MENMLNLIIITLLTVAIIYAMILNYRFNTLRESKREIVKAIDTFNQVVKNAETTLSQIQKSSENISENLKMEINKANAVRDDLVLILDKNAQARNIETKRTTPIYRVPSKQPTNTYRKDFYTFESKKTSIGDYESEAEKELVMALQRLKEETCPKKVI